MKQTDLLSPESKNGTALQKTESFASLEGFVSRMHSDPSAASIKVNSAANNSRYLPISHIEMTLDEVFMGLWNWEFKSFQVVANEIIGVGRLEFFHPIAKQWLHRTGTGAVMIQQKSGSEITDIGAKFKNTLVKDFPHLESECLKSAAKKIGKIFGRDLNREFDDSYQPIYSQEAELGEDYEEIKRKLANASTTEELKMLWNSYEQYHSAKSFIQVFSARKRELQIRK